MSNPIPLPPFKAFLASNIPSVYDNTLSYYDELTKLIAYIEELVPVVNENTAGLAALKEYVEHYFDNLDVQEEINNKLDEMAEGGQLAAIIAEFLAVAPVFAFNTISDLASAENLINGSTARVLGNDDAQDGDGAYYLVRTRQEADDPDGFNLVAIGDTLVGQRIVEPDTDAERVILIGDSYALDRRPSINITGWAVPLQDLLGLSNDDCYIIQDNGGGFVHSGSDGTFLQALQNLAVTSKNTITKIVVCGGLNDCGQTKDTILAAIESFMDYCKANYENAKVYIGHIGNENNDINYDGQTLRFYCLNRSIPAYKASTQFGAIYLNGVENVMKDYGNFYDHSHPNQALCDELARDIFQALNAGSVNVEYPAAYSLPISYDTVSGTNFNEDTLPFTEKFVNGNDLLLNYPVANSTLTFTTAQNVDRTQIILGNVVMNYCRNVVPNQAIGKCDVTFTLSDTTKLYCQGCTLELYYYNYKTYLVLNKPATTSANATELSFRQFTINIPGAIC